MIGVHSPPASEPRSTGSRLAGDDPAIARERIEAAARYAETGEAQSLSSPASPDWYAGTGQRERALAAMGALVRAGSYFGAATQDALGTRDLLGDDTRYQALLEEAGITW